MESINRSFSAGEALSVLSLTRLIEKAAILRNRNRIRFNCDKPAMLLSRLDAIQNFSGAKCVLISIGYPEFQLSPHKCSYCSILKSICSKNG